MSRLPHVDAVRTAAHRTRTAGGFSLPEVMIALFLLAVALAVLMPMLINMTGFSNSAVAQGAAGNDGRNAAAEVESDISQIGSDKRVSTLRNDDATGLIQTLDGNSNGNHDIVVAGPTRFDFWSDATSTRSSTGGGAEKAPGAEYISWRLVRNSAQCGYESTPNWCVVRTVWYGPHSPGVKPGRSSTEVAAYGSGSPPPDTTCYPGAPSHIRIFCYRTSQPRGGNYSWNGWKPTCTSQWSTAFDSAQRPWNYGWLSTHHESYQTDRLTTADTITAVGIAIPAGATVGGHQSVTEQTSVVNIQGHSSSDYQTAIECGSR